MKAVRIHTYGGPEVLTVEETPIPTPGDGEVLIRVKAASINPIDWKVRAGYLQAFLNLPLPLVQGMDLAGVVEAVGPGVTDVSVGDSVYGSSNIFRQGGYAEYAVLSTAELAHKPKSVDFTHAAAAGLAALSAWQSLKAVDLQPGQTILIHGGGGGIGTFAIQFARQQGARVIATASPAKAELLRELGVDEIIDYTTTRFEDVARDVDVVLDNIGGEVMDRSWAVLKPGGTLVTLAAQADQAAAAAHNVNTIGVGAQANTADFAAIASLIDSGKVKPIVSTILPLDEARKGQELLAQGHALGKIVLNVSA